jgi:hypothetical protein
MGVHTPFMEIGDIPLNRLLELAFTLFPVNLSELSYYIVVGKLLNTLRSRQ